MRGGEGPHLLRMHPPDLSTMEGQAAVNELLPGVALIVVDNLATLGGRGDESEGAAWLPLQGWLLGLRRRGVAVLMIHHSGKGGQQRGTSRREDVLDTVIGLRRPKDYTADQGARFEVHFEKSRGFYGDTAKPFEARLAAGAGDQLTWLVRDLEDEKFQITAALVADGLSQRAIAKELGISHQAVGKRMRRAKQLGLIDPATASGKQGRG